MYRKTSWFIIIVLVLTSQSGFAAWVGPETILNGGWGGEPNQFAIEEQDSGTEFPLVTDISSEGHIAISDEYNGRMKVYAANGSLLWNAVPPVDDPVGWAMTPKFIGQNLVIPIYNYFFYSTSGDLLAQLESPGKSIFKGERNGILYVANTVPAKRWLTYSPTGNLLNTFTEKPLELGHIEDDQFIYQGQKLHRVTVSFPNRQWIIVGLHGPCFEYDYQVDAADNLYCVGQQNAERYSVCGKEIANFNMPQGSYKIVAPAGPEDSGIDPVSQLVEEYRGIVMGDDGSIYASRATQENFSVVRWTWQDSPNDPIGGPDAPVELSALAADGVTLSWTFSLQDPGCVTQYEIGRSTTAGGPYAKVANVPASGKTKEPYAYTDATVESGTTYYYAVRAISAIANSPYSNEVSIQAQ